jgi:cytochrome c-type protein NapC
MKIIAFLWRPWLAFVAIGLVLGVAASGIFAGALWYTSTDSFCSGCHAANAVPEWKGSVHYANRAGMAVGCADCHEPKDPLGMLLRKVAAMKETYHHIRGTINTPEKYEAHRLEMAEREWARLKADDALACRACHEPARMQDPAHAAVAKTHRTAIANGQICTDCHKGVAHKAPNIPGED